MFLYLAWLCRTRLISYKITMPVFISKGKMFFVSCCVVVREEHYKDFNYLFCPNQKGFSQTSLMKRCGGFLFICGWFFFSFLNFFFSKLLLVSGPSIWSWQFYLSPEIKAMRHVLLAFWIATLFVYRTCWSEIYCIGMAFVSSPKDIPSLPHVLISILSFTLILWWKVHASSSTCEWCFFLFFLSPCLNFLASLPFLSLYSLLFLSDAEMKIVGCKFLLFCVMSAYCLLFPIFISFMECWG